MPTLTVAIIAKDEEAHIARALKSARGLAEQIIVVVDDRTTDRTATIARAFTDDVFVHPWHGYGPQKNAAREQARGEWVFFLDADEEISPDLRAELTRLVSGTEQGVGRRLSKVFFVPIVTVFLGRPLRHLWGTNPRLLRRREVRWNDRAIHEQAIRSDGSVVRLGDPDTDLLNHPLLHPSHYDTLSAYREKRERYTSRDAEDTLRTGLDRLGKPVGNPKESFLTTVQFLFTRAAKQFLRLFLKKRGFLDGWQGWLWCWLSAQYEYIVCRKVLLLTDARTRLLGPPQQAAPPIVVTPSRTQQPMRITHVTLRYPPASGGVEEYVRAIVERLRAEGDAVSVETTHLQTHHPATILRGILKDPPYVRRHPAWTFHRLAYPVPRSLSASLAASPPDVIHAHGFWYAPADIAARSARRQNIPFVLNPYYAPRTKMLWKVYRELIGNATIAAADAVVVISPQEASALRADGYTFRRIELIPPGIDPQEFGERRPNPFVRYGLQNKDVLLFAGRIAAAKGIDLLLEALPNIIRGAEDCDLNVHCCIAGEDFGDRAALEDLAERLGIAHAVSWLGKLSREDLLAAYQHARAFIFPSRYEAFGIAVLEAQAAGCPVVASDTASLPFLVQHEQTGLLFQPDNPHDLVAKVLALLRNHDHARALAATGRDRAHREFAWDQNVAKLRTLYTDLVAPHRRP